MAIARPGSLGDDDGETAASTTTERAAETTSPPSTTAAPTTTSAPTTTVAASEQSGEGEGESATDATVASGLAAEGSGSVRAPGEPIADTGGEAMIGLGLALLALGLAARRAGRPA